MEHAADILLAIGVICEAVAIIMLANWLLEISRRNRGN